MNLRYSYQLTSHVRRYKKPFFLYATLLSTVALIGTSTVYADESQESSPATELVGENTAKTEQKVEVTETSEEDAAVTSDVDSQQLQSILAQAAPVSENQQVMSAEEKQRAIAQMGANQGDVWVWSEENVVEEEGERQKRGPNGGPGQFNGGAVVLGGRPTYDPAADWYYLAYKGPNMTDEEAQAVFDKERGKWMNEFDPWGVVLEMADNKASNAWADIRNMQAFILRKDATTWEKIVDHPEGVQWVAQFKGNMSTYVEDANQSPLYNRGGTSVEILTKQDRVAHWGSDQARGIPNPETIRAVLVSVEARISERSDPDAKIGIQVGGDWKFAEEVSKPLWYPGAGLAGIQRLTKDWARYYFVSLTGIQDAMPERAITQEEFLNTTVPLPAMVTHSSQTIPDGQSGNQSSNHQQSSSAGVADKESDTGRAGAANADSENKGVTQLSLHKEEQKKPAVTASPLSAKRLPETGTENHHLFAGLFAAISAVLGLGALQLKKEEK